MPAANLVRGAVRLCNNIGPQMLRAYSSVVEHTIADRVVPCSNHGGPSFFHLPSDFLSQTLCPACNEHQSRGIEETLHFYLKG